MLAEDPARAFYGPGHVFAAAELGAIQTLMISDNLFRINSVEKRQVIDEGCNRGVMTVRVPHWGAWGQCLME